MIKSKTGAKQVAPKTAVKKIAVKKITIPTPEVAVEVASSVRKVVATTKVSVEKTGIDKVAAAAPKKGVKIVAPNTNGVGRRKSSVARVWLKRGKGEIVINGKSIQDYFPTNETRVEVIKPLVICQVQGTYNLKVNVVGGGICSQAGAVRLGVARALLKENEALRPVLRENGLLTVDSRLKERKKPGQPGARRKFQFVKR
jgi:small subunit ribosomal protein S9